MQDEFDVGRGGASELLADAGRDGLCGIGGRDGVGEMVPARMMGVTDHFLRKRGIARFKTGD